MTTFNARVHPFKDPVNRKQYAVDVINEEVSRSFSAEDKEKIGRFWEDIVKPKSPHLFSKPIMINVEKLTLLNGSISEEARLLEYSAFVAKRAPDFLPAESGISAEAKQLIRAHCVSPITLTSDGDILLGKRPQRILAEGQITNMPEGMPTIKSAPNPFDFFKIRLRNEIGVDEIEHMEMTGFGEELDYPSIVTSLFVQLGSTNANVEEAMAHKQDAQGAPKKPIFLDTKFSSMFGFIEKGIHPGGPSTAMLNAINYYHTRADFDNAVDRLGIRSYISETLEEFAAPTGIQIRRL